MTRVVNDNGSNESDVGSGNSERTPIDEMLVASRNKDDITDAYNRLS